MVPVWLHALATISIALGIASAGLIAFDEYLRPRRMRIMNAVWPLTALFAGPAGLYVYFRYSSPLAEKKSSNPTTAARHSKQGPPFPVSVAKGTSHCGAGCCLGDILAEWLAFFVPAICVWFGWKSLFSEKMFAVWVLDFIFAFAFGIAFQYFTIAPMRHLSPVQGLRQALKADALSLFGWQLGMYTIMAAGQFYIFGRYFGTKVKVDSVEFWFMMQLGMIGGFITSYPVNWWLIRSGIKERM